MNPSFEQTLVEVWRQALVENLKAVKIGGESYPIRRTAKRGLRQVDFVFDGNEIRGLEQNPDTKSRWAQFGKIGKEGDAVSQQRELCSECGRWKSDSLRQSRVILNRIEARRAPSSVSFFF